MDEEQRVNLQAALDEIRNMKAIGWTVLKLNHSQLDALEDACVLALEQ